jgi:hypothetical protein
MRLTTPSTVSTFPTRGVANGDAVDVLTATPSTISTFPTRGVGNVASVEGELWMVRVALSRATGTDRGEVTRWTAVDLDPDDTTPGVYPLLFEQGRLERSAAGWNALRTRVEAFNDDEAFARAAAIYDAARGFLELGIPPNAGPLAVAAPDVLSVELGDAAWSFSASAAPAQAWALLRAAAAPRGRAARPAGACAASPSS